ncbi:MAG: PilW family protein [Candidatus Thiodiazotropha sp. (ex Lucinoma borealis)]|nr:PilW family protein [Candidatus Thiodiazotropha sp. (ex Lucinoma borealis)]MCU7854966.1 PilW family protein [Candidatus Thiodiazotropha sp. (ex Lucinoma borealis)]MCU7866746.1 PilW family protein [Candidatus Thiodiazotropha sp. (ex Lucinoma borealis)]MCU7868107.1 PilW family protein [Candidatus Thiodiazotropha sp. (ex Lucinoma borealis)]
MTSIVKQQAGFSIVSLLIASVIGIFLIGGAGKVYVDSKNTFTARSAITAATESSRFAIQDLRRTLVMAGRNIGEFVDGPEAYASPDNGIRTFPAVGAVNGIIDIDANGSSVIAIRYAGGPAPCGQAGTLATPATVRFYRDDDANLVCQVVETNFVQPLVSGVVIMRALYGVDTDANDIANQYLTATEVDTANRWLNVVSIRIGMITSSGDGTELPARYRPAAAEELDLLGMTFTAPDTSHFYKSASTTISLRNLHSSVQKQ